MNNKLVNQSTYNNLPLKWVNSAYRHNSKIVVLLCPNNIPSHLQYHQADTASVFLCVYFMRKLETILPLEVDCCSTQNLSAIFAPKLV